MNNSIYTTVPNALLVTPSADAYVDLNSAEGGWTMQTA